MPIGRSARRRVADRLLQAEDAADAEQHHVGRRRAGAVGGREVPVTRRTSCARRRPRQRLTLRRADDELGKATLFPIDVARRRDRPAGREAARSCCTGRPAPARPTSPRSSPSTSTGDGGEAELVQFHPSYAYEDFFEGYRPVGSGTAVGFEVKPGPLKQLADRRPRRPGQPVRPDHRRDQPRQPRQGLRRAVLPARVPRPHDHAAVLRRGVHAARQPVRHRHDEHRRPLDRPRRRGDAAPLLLRRDVADRPAPSTGSCARGSRTDGLDDRPARLLDELNRRIGDPDAAIGPSYLMTDGRRRAGPARTDLGARHPARAARALLRQPPTATSKRFAYAEICAAVDQGEP